MPLRQIAMAMASVARCAIISAFIARPALDGLSPSAMGKKLVARRNLSDETPGGRAGRRGEDRMMEGLGVWEASWLWCLPACVATVFIQVLGASVLRTMTDRMASEHHKRSATRYMLTVMFVGLGSMMLLALAAEVWVWLYLFLGALPDHRSAALYSMSALTGYGHATIYLEPRWQMLGAIEALNGLILLGMTTAFLYSVVHQVRVRVGW